MHMLTTAEFVPLCGLAAIGAGAVFLLVYKVIEELTMYGR